MSPLVNFGSAAAGVLGYDPAAPGHPLVTGQHRCADPGQGPGRTVQGFGVEAGNKLPPQRRWLARPAISAG